MNRSKVMTLLRKDPTWHIAKEGKDGVKVLKQFGKGKPKVIAFVLVCVKDGVYLKHPSYDFVSTVSHFKAVQTDKRLSLNKTYLKSIIRSLKALGLWEAVVNKDFLEINKNNKKSDKGTVRKELYSLLR